VVGITTGDWSKIESEDDDMPDDDTEEEEPEGDKDKRD
jgi:hypothetical protein